MPLSQISRFLLVGLCLLLLLMPLWYWMASELAYPVLRMAGALMHWCFHWVDGVQIEGTVAVLRTKIVVPVPLPDGVVGIGEIAPKVDYKLFGYGIVMFWSLLFAVNAKNIIVKILVGSLVMMLVQVQALCFQWINDVLSNAGVDVFRQAGSPYLWREISRFLFHFNLFIFTALAPVLLWLALERAFVTKLWVEMVLAGAVQAPADRK